MKKSKKLWIFASILIFANGIYYLAQWGGDSVLQYVSDILPIVASFISVLCLYSAFSVFKKFDYTKMAWFLIFIGISLFFLAESIYAYLEIVLKTDMNETFPSLADYFWCLGYFPMFIGLGMMYFGYKKSGLPMGKTKLYVGLSALILIVSISVIYFLLVPIIKDEETSLLSKVFYLFYPIADLFLVIPAVILIYITSLFGAGAVSKPWKYLAIGFILTTIADLLYSYLGWLDLYGNGNLIDLAWHGGYLMIGLAGLYQRELIESLNNN